MPPSAPWSPTAHAFAQHQFSHVTNFWKQGRTASFRLEALPDGKAELNLTFQLPTASEVIPPPFFSSPAPTLKRPIIPLFPEGYAPPHYNTKQAPKFSSRRRKKYRRSVLHRAALAVPNLPPPENGSLRQAAQASVQRLKAGSVFPVSTPSGNKRPFPDSSSPSPSNLPPLPQRIRKDIQIDESEVESPEKEILRSPPISENSPSPIDSPEKEILRSFPFLENSPDHPALFSPCLKDVLSPVPLPPEKPSCSNCDADMSLDHQCEVIESDSEDVQGGEISPPKDAERAQRLLSLQKLTNDRAHKLFMEGLQIFTTGLADP